MNESPFKISGKERRLKKKELSEMKSFVKMFWHYEDLDRVYGGGMSDKKCQDMINKYNEKISILESELSESSISIKREEKLEKIFNE
jgi:hypothetical protein